MSENTRNTIRPAAHAFEYACASLGANVIASRLEHNIEDIQPIVAHLREMGQTNFINLTHKYDEGRVVVPLYAGDGIVTKIIPPEFFDASEPVLAMPAITSHTVETDNNKYLINTYPWLKPSPVVKETVTTMQAVLDDLGMSFTSGDGHPRNIHMMPDVRQTLAGIDSDMFRVSQDGYAASEELQDIWRTYIETMFPIYKDGLIPIQTEETDFRFLSIHDPDTGIVTFDPLRDDPIVYHEDEPSSKPGWRSIFGLPENDGIEPI